MKNYLIIIISIILSFNSTAGELVRDAEVIEVSNTNNNGPDFSIRINGGVWTTTSSTCSLTTGIIFPESKSQSSDSHKQAFSIALTALTTGKKVRIHNFEDDTCTGANFISISK